MPEPQSSEHLFGEIGVSLGLLTREQLQQAVARQQALKAEGRGSRLGELLVLMNFLAKAQVERILRTQQQRRTDVPPPFQRLGSYTLETKLGPGILGSVYRARDVNQRLVAFKIFHEALCRDPQVRERLLKHIQMLARLENPNRVTVLEGGVAQGRAYLAMELLEGETLQAVLEREKPLSEGRAVAFALGIAQALLIAHRTELPHYNLKPQNVFLLPDGTLKVADFGLAHAVFGPALLPKTGEISGMPYYLAPEQVRGEALDFRTDFFSLGGILYHMLTGQPPFQADTGVEVFIRKLSAQSLLNPKDLNPRISDDLVKVVMKLMAKEPSARYPSAVVLLEDLTQIAKGARAEYTRLDQKRSSIKAQAPAATRPLPEKKGCLSGVLLVGGVVAWLLTR